jgi:hypothetical protein
MSGAGELAMFLAIGAAAVALLFGPIGSALARRLGGRAELGDSQAEIEEMRARVTGEVEQLHTRLGEMDSLHARVLELEERVDFTERLLAQTQGPKGTIRGESQ